jgi:hypothetical protein
MSKLSYQIVIPCPNGGPFLHVEPSTYYSTFGGAVSQFDRLRAENPAINELEVVTVDRDAPMEVGHGE